MGFVFSLIIIYFLGFLSHYFYTWRGHRQKNKLWIYNYGLTVNLIFLIGGILMYVNALQWLVSAFNGLPWMSDCAFADGKDFMWNGCRLLGFNTAIPTVCDLNPIAIMLFLCYLPVYLYGKMGSQLIFGRRTYQRGAMWALTG